MFAFGIDVSKQKLDITLLVDNQRLKRRSKKLPNTPAGHQALLEWGRQHTGVEPEHWHIALEATGPYHEALAWALHQAGAVVSVLNPRQVKGYAASLNLKAKNDRLDALVLARFVVERQPPAWQPDPPEVRQLQALLRRLQALEDDRQREQNRREKAQISRASEEVLASLERSLGFLEAERQQLIKTLDDHIDRHPELKDSRQHLESIPGIGEVLSRWMLALLHKSQSFESAPQLASYLGLTPTEHQSGSSVHPRPHLSKCGPPKVRAKLYMAALSAVSCNPDVKALYERLLAKGKCKMLALGAAMRKLVHICFGVVKNHCDYQPQIASRG